MRRNSLSLLLIPAFAAIAVVIYFPAYWGGWVLDDYHNIVFNGELRSLAQRTLEVFSQRGVSYLSFAIDYSLWGTDASLSRSVNVFIHVLNSLLVYIVVRELLFKLDQRWAVFAGLLFLSHPVQTSAVNYVVQRMTLLSCFFALVSIILLCRYFRTESNIKNVKIILLLVAAVFFGVLSILSKENTALLPVMVPLLAWYFKEKRIGKIATPLAMLSIAPALGVLVQFSSSVSTYGQLANLTFYEDSGAAYLTPVTDTSLLGVRYLLSQGEVFWKYLQLLFFPYQQTLDYLWPLPSLGFNLVAFFAFGLMSVLLVFAFINREKFPLSLFGLLWFFIFMAVESSIIPLDTIFEHRLYLPLIGIVLILMEQVFFRMPPKRAVFAGSLLLVCLVGVAHTRSVVWGDTISLLEDNVKMAPRSVRARDLLAHKYLSEHRYAEAAVIYSDLYSHSRHISRLLRMAEAEFFAGNREKAMKSFSLADAKDPENNSIEVFRAYIAMDSERWDDAENWLRLAEKKDPSDIRIYFVRAKLAERRGLLIDACAWYQKILNKEITLAISDKYIDRNIYLIWARQRRIALLDSLGEWLRTEKEKVWASPVDLNAMGHYANVLLRLGLFEEAIDVYLELQERAPEHWSLYYNLGICYEKLGRLGQAMASYRRALQLKPNEPLVLQNLGFVSLLNKDYPVAENALRKLTEILPENGKGWYGLGVVLIASGDIDEARKSLERASLSPAYRKRALKDIKTIDDLR